MRGDPTRRVKFVSRQQRKVWSETFSELSAPEKEAWCDILRAIPAGIDIVPKYSLWLMLAARVLVEYRNFSSDVSEAELAGYSPDERRQHDELMESMRNDQAEVVRLYLEDVQLDENLQRIGPAAIPAPCVIQPV